MPNDASSAITGPVLRHVTENPGALDDDQGANAAFLASGGGALLVRQSDLSAEKLAKLLSSAMKNPQTLAKQAENAKKAGVPDAAARLADLVQAHVT